MDKTNDNKFFIVEFIKEPYKNIPKYVCIPSSWIGFEDPNTNIAAVKYPVENLLDTNRRVQNKECFSKDWSIYEVRIIQATDSFQEAQGYINKLVDNIIKQQNVSDNSQVVSQGISPAKKQSSGRSRRCDDPNIESPTPTKKQRQSQESSKSSQSQNLQTKEQNQMKPNANPTSEKNSAPNIIENNSTRNSPITNTRTLDHRKLSDVSDLLKNLHDCVKENQILMQYLQVTYNRNSLNINKLIETIDDLKNIKKINPVTHSEKRQSKESEEEPENGEEQGDEVQEVTDGEQEEMDGEMQTEEGIEVANRDDGTEAEGEEEREDTESEEEEHDEENDGNVSWDECEEQGNSRRNSTARGQPYDFTLPPDYNEKDSRWTLKYHDLSTELEELVPHSNIYVNRSGLNNCLEKSKDVKSLARNLLAEIFTESALRTCSATGKKANAFKGSKIRPGLDQKAITVLLNYVDVMAMENGLDRPQSSDIMSAIRNKLQETRAKYYRLQQGR